MKKVEIFGMTIKDYPLKESLKVTRSYLHESGIHTIAYVSRDLLMSAYEYPSQKKWVEDLDLTIFDEPIEADAKNHLSAVNHDGKSDDYLDTILRNISASKAAIYLVSDTKENLEALKKTLNSLNTKLLFIGEKVFDADGVENMFNEINCLGPKLVISCMPWVRQGALMHESKRMLEASIWLGFLPSFIENNDGGIKKRFNKFVNQIKFAIKLKKYSKQQM